MTEIAQLSSKLLSFPREILVEILKRLPVKSLIRSAFVCKKLRSLILADHQLNVLHSDYSNRCPWKHPFFISWKPHSRTISMTTASGNGINMFNGDDKDDMQPHILGSCNGLFFLEIEGKGNLREYVLWNPYTHSMKKVHEIDHGYPFTHLISGLGYDHKTRDYKAVMVIGIGIHPRDYTDDLKKFRVLVYLFSLQANSWKLLNSDAGIDILTNYSLNTGFGSTTFNGIPHWVGKHKPSMTNYELGFSLVCFDPGTNMFGELSLPEQNHDYAGQCGAQIGVLGGYLCAAVTLQKINVVEVWEMKEYGVKDSWTKLYSIRLLQPTKSTSLKPLGYSSTGKLVMFSVERIQATYRRLTDPEFFLDKYYWSCNVKGDATGFFSFTSYTPSTLIVAEAYTESLIWPIEEETEIPQSPSKLLSFSHEILLEVLKRLPLKSLTRSAFVCKKWRSLILTDEKFNKLHFEYNNRSPWKHPFFISWEPPSMKSTFDYNFNWDEFVPYCPDVVLQPHILGSCDGLFFMQISTPSEENEDNFREFVLWNPYTNSVKTLSELDHGDPLISGLAYDYKTRDLKALMVISILPAVGKSSRLRNCNFLVCMFSFHGNSWKLLTSNGVLSKYKFESGFASTTFNGIPHWVGQYQSKLGFGLVCFDPDTDMFKEMSLPDKTRGGEVGVQIGILGGCLCTAITLLNSNVVEVWSMNKYGVKDSWRKLHSIKLLKPTYSISLKPLGYSSEGKLVMVSVEYPDEYPFRAYWACDLRKNGNGTAVQVLTAFSAATTVVAEVYTESLMWPVKETLS